MSVQALLRIGMFGGAFDPPHRAHVALARAAVAQLALDRLLVVPTGQAWHKARALTPAEHRLALAQVAFDDVPNAVVDDRELRRAGPTYTVDTLSGLAGEFPGAELFLVMGEDQADSFASWRDWPRVAALATLAVAPRGEAGQGLANLARLPGVRAVALTAMAPRPDSATEVRARLTAGQDIAQLVAPDVAGYIAHHHLYQTA